MKDRTEYMREYQRKNRERINERNRERYHSSADLRLKRMEANKKYYRANKEKWIDYEAAKKEKTIENLKKKLGGMKL